MYFGGEYTLLSVRKRIVSSAIMSYRVFYTVSSAIMIVLQGVLYC